MLKKIFKTINKSLKKISVGKTIHAPLIILQKDADVANIKEYNSLESAIADLENDSNVSKEKLEKLKASFKNLKFKSSIKIKESEIILTSQTNLKNNES